MTDMPEPMTTPDVDVRDLDGFMLNAERLLASELWALASGEEFKAAMGLWCRAWKQIPAGSLPNDQRVLASFAGVTPHRWAKVREVALRGFLLCSDGRLYHHVLCADARRAFGRKEAMRAERDGDADRKRRERDDRARLFAQLRAAGHVLPYNTPTSDLRGMVDRMSREMSEDVTRDASRTVTVPQGQGQGQGQEETASSPPPSPAREPATTATALKKFHKVTGIDTAAARRAIESNDLVGVIRAYGGNLAGERAAEWARDCHGKTINHIAVVMGWRFRMGTPVREPSGFRSALELWHKGLNAAERRILSIEEMARIGIETRVVEPQPAVPA